MGKNDEKATTVRSQVEQLLRSQHFNRNPDIHVASQQILTLVSNLEAEVEHFKDCFDGCLKDLLKHEADNARLRKALEEIAEYQSHYWRFQAVIDIASKALQAVDE